VVWLADALRDSVQVHGHRRIVPFLRRVKNRVLEESNLE
jgi:hypothetical protein